jgi:antitoxin component of MazEF toxin-antitoxin module
MPIRSGRNPTKKARRTRQIVKTGADLLPNESSVLAEPEVSYATRIRAIGNSKGVILNSLVMETAGLNAETDVIIHASKGIIKIMEVKKDEVNTDLSTWDKQFKTAIKNGSVPDKDLFEGLQNDFDSKEW